jgi:CubicO group peptidase (beta-lactamase class C family)
MVRRTSGSSAQGFGAVRHSALPFFAALRGVKQLALWSWFFVLVACGAAPSDNVWKTASPEEVGLDSEELAKMFEFVREKGIPVHSVQIVRHGRLALDAYFYPYRSDTRHDVASVTKSITSTLVGLAIKRGYLGDVQQPIMAMFPEHRLMNVDERKRKLNIEHLLTMSAGWDCGFEPKEGRLFEMRRSADWLQFMLDLPMVADPGTRWAYCSGNCHVLSILLTQVVGTNALAFARRELFAPLGIKDIGWASDSRGNNHGWGDLQLHPRDMARIGQLLLQRGRWREQEIIPEAWIAEATREHVERTSNKDHYGYFWWVKGKDYPGMFEAVGRGGQRVNVWPAKDMVIVFTGGGFEPGDLAPFILKSLKSDNPLPSNGKAVARLKERIGGATKAPSARPLPKAPAMANQISGKEFQLGANSMNLKTVGFKFGDRPEALAEFVWEDRRITVPIGLDGVERFSTNDLINLPQAAKGEWLNEQTFRLDLDLVGGINFYSTKFTFSEDGKMVIVNLKERTGLSDEQFTGTALH